MAVAKSKKGIDGTRRYMPVTPSAGRRATAVAGRRARILAAARRLLVDGADAFSMRKLAAEASVSVFTVYNLIGGQSAVIEAIVNGPARELITQMRRRADPSPIKELLREVRRFDRQWNDESHDMLAAVRALPYLRDGALQTWFRDALATQFLPLFKAAVLAEELRPNPAPEILIEILTAIVVQAVESWSKHDNDFEACKRTVLLGIAVLVLSVVPESGRAPWEALIAHLSK